MPPGNLRVLGWLAAFVAALAGSEAKAITFSDVYSVNVSGPDADSVEELGPISLIQNEAGFTLNGDISFAVAPEGQASINAFNNFSIGLLPELVSYNLLQEFKVVIGGGNLLHPDASVTVTS